jgi:hypothetical protein
MISFLRTIFAASVFTFAAATSSAWLITPEYRLLLETWVGQGSLTLTNVYTKQTGDTSLDFHAAVDGKGPTFLAMEIFGHGPEQNFLPSIEGTQIIGGYNPQSWSSGPDLYTHTPDDADRTAFIYNLTGNRMQAQTLGPDFYAQFQTHNDGNYGPIFGVGDISFNPLTLDWGSAVNASYGNPLAAGQTIVDGATNKPGSPGHIYSIGALEVYTFVNNPSAVPDSGPSITLLALGISTLFGLRRKMATRGKGRLSLPE